MSLNTLNDIFFGIAKRNQPEFLLQLVGEQWQPISSQEFAAKVGGVVSALRSWGIAKGDRVAILGENRHEWVVADMACFLLGAVVVPIYTTLTAEQIEYMLKDSGARAIFVSLEKTSGKGAFHRRIHVPGKDCCHGRCARKPRDSNVGGDATGLQHRY